MNNPPRSPQETAKKIAEHFFGIGDSNAERMSAIRRLLGGAIVCAVLIPLLFYFQFGEVGGLGWGMTIFFVIYCLVAALAEVMRPKTEYHTPVRLHNDWADRVGAFWLVACVFGPLLGWGMTAAFPLTESTWRWLYTLRFALATLLPVLTALPLIRYLRGKAVWIGLPLLVFITLLPILSVVNVGRDLWDGPIAQQAQTGHDIVWYLQYSQQFIDTK
jgi:hypothetical protein